jgi:DNA-binding CsgD family transcriptional regulator
MSTGDLHTAAPFPADLVEATAHEHGVDPAALGDALAAVHADLADGADAVYGYYRSGETPAPLPVADGLAVVLFLGADPLEQVPTDVDPDLRPAVAAAHAALAREGGADEAVLAAREPLVLPSEAVGRLVRAGLSRRQAEVQLLREHGVGVEATADRLGIAPSTVKVHRHRVDSKVAAARQLLEHVEG